MDFSKFSRILESFVPSKARPLAPRPYLVPSIYLTCVFGSFLPPGKVRAGSVALTVGYLIAQIPKATAGDVASDVLTPIQAVLCLAQWFDFYMFHRPDQFYRLSDKEHPPQTLWEKFKWYLDLNASMRGIGWNWQVKNIPTQPHTTKWQFVRTQLAKAVMWYLLLDISSSIGRRSIYGSRNCPDLSFVDFPRQLLFTWIPALGSYWGIVFQYSVFSSLAVTCGLFTPQDWPPITGKLRDVYSVRDLWGKFWHQMLRRKLNIPFNVLTYYFPIRRGTLLSKYGQLYLAFIASGLLHALGAMNVAGSNTYDNMFLQLNYFLVQPVAITFEDSIIHLGRQLGIRSSWKTKLLGRVWTFAWFSFSLRLTAIHHYRLGIYETSPLPSLTDWLLST